MDNESVAPEGFTLCRIAEACASVDISDSQFEALSIELLYGAPPDTSAEALQSISDFGQAQDAAPQQHAQAALSDDDIKAIAVNYATHVAADIYDVTKYDCAEDFFNCVRAILATRQPAPVDDDDGPEFTVSDPDLDALLNAAADYAKGKNQNMDTGLHMMSLLERVQDRLKIAPVAAAVAQVDPLDGVAPAEVRRVMRANLKDGSWIARTGRLDLWALYRPAPIGFIRMLNRFEQEFVDGAIDSARGLYNQQGRAVIPTKAIAINLALMLNEWVGDGSGDWRSGAASVIEHRLNRLLTRSLHGVGSDVALSNEEILKLAKGINFTTQEERHFYEDSYMANVDDTNEIIKFARRITAAMAAQQGEKA